MASNRPKGSGLQGEITRFFERNPDEVLLTWDICVKFGVTRRQVTQALWWLRKRGVVNAKNGIIKKMHND